jgi:hypothetical protein
MPQLSRALPPLLAGVALAAGGCGGDEETRGLSQVKSDRLLALLDNAEQQFEGGDCAELTGTLTDLADEVNEVDSEVDEGVRNALSTEAQELVDLASTDCQVVETTTEIVPTTVPTVPTTTEETEPTTETEPTEEIPTEEEPPGEGPGGEGPPGQEEDSESGLKPPKEPEEEAVVPGGET